jgi:putative redox protein
MSFKSTQYGHDIILDADEKVGGTDKGTRPKVLLLTALAGCTGMDIVSILKKMKVTDYKLDISVDGELTEEHPKIYHTITVTFNFTGTELPEDKIKRAVELSETRYCGVSAMLRKAAQITNIIRINEGDIS